MKNVLGVALFSLMLASVASVASADESEADRRFDEGKALLEKGDVRAACDAFEASNRLERGVGTTLHLASCREKLGDLRAAYDTFVAARALALESRDDRVAVADKYIAAIDARLGKIRIVLSPETDVDGLVVEVDGVALDASAVHDMVRVAPGRHLVRATAPGKRKFVSMIEARGEVVDVRVVWQAAKVPGRPSVGAPDEPSSWTGIHTAGLVTGAVAVTAIAGGAISGAMAFSSWSDAESQCSSGEGTRVCSEEGVDFASHATTESTLSTALFVGGGAAAAASVILFVLAPGADDTAEVAVAPVVGPGVVGLTLGGRFQ